jgi:uncharacterized protein (DUF1778 family)
MDKPKKHINLKLDSALHSKLKAVASLDSKTIQDYVLEAIMEKVNHEGKL